MEKKLYIYPQTKVIYFNPRILDISIDTGGNHDSGDPGEEGEQASKRHSLWDDLEDSDIEW